jgi:hypothetical protein
VRCCAIQTSRSIKPIELSHRPCITGADVAGRVTNANSSMGIHHFLPEYMIAGHREGTSGGSASPLE